MTLNMLRKMMRLREGGLPNSDMADKGGRGGGMMRTLADKWGGDVWTPPVLADILSEQTLMAIFFCQLVMIVNTTVQYIAVFKLLTLFIINHLFSWLWQRPKLQRYLAADWLALSPIARGLAAGHQGHIRVQQKISSAKVGQTQTL